MKNFFRKIGEFFSRIWHGLSVAGRIIIGLILIGLIGWTVYASTDKSDDSNNNDAAPEIAQNYEPSIGTPLPPDNIADTDGRVDGAATTEPANPAPENVMTAPPTGVDPSQPVKYSNDSLNFAAVLPAGSMVNEKPDGVHFSSEFGKLHYIVSVSDAGSETLQTLESQLRNSTNASNLTYTKIMNSQAIKFTAKDYGTGIAFVANGKVYYLLGNSQYFSDFKLL